MSKPIEVRRIGGNIGAEIHGADLSKPLSAEQFAQILQALHRHEVIVFRDQDISLEQQKAFGRRFGELSIHPFSPNLDDQRDVIVLDYSADNPPALTDQWHSDETFRKNPPKATILRARVVPEYGGDTLFSSMTAAYHGLSERMKAYIHGMVAQHDFKPWRPLFTSSPEHQASLARLEQLYPNPWHPVVRIHPHTGRRLINVNAQFTVKIQGLKNDESESLLHYLYSRAQIPEFQCRIRWQPNTVVMWDNCAVQHYAPHDYYPQRRTMERVTITGDDVIGVSGVSGDYSQEQGVAPLPDGKQVRPGAGKRPIREFERHLQEKSNA